MTESLSLEKFSTLILPKYVVAGTVSVKDARILVLLVTEFLTETIDSIFLKYVSRFLTPEFYDDVVAERNVLHLCGYPTCDLSPTKKVLGKDVPQIVYTERQSSSSPAGGPSSYLNQYCTKFHFQSSKFYRAQLSDEAVWARKNITYLRNGHAEWERSIKLLDEVLAEREGDRERKTVNEKEVQEAVQKIGLLKITNRDFEIENNVDETKAPISFREKLEKNRTKKLKESSSKLEISERDVDKSKSQIKPVIFGINDAGAVEGYVPGSVKSLKLPQAYIERKILEREIAKEFGEEVDDDDDEINENEHNSDDDDDDDEDEDGSF
ncbi:hypothetical protein V1514DRAFT_193324 [Lipomyces japonicus]|uniref:uncharacterized protein n=1 Tax=Lipomyces japonicus TaxID=56871 RepID=UPI0034CFCF73